MCLNYNTRPGDVRKRGARYSNYYRYIIVITDARVRVFVAVRVRFSRVLLRESGERSAYTVARDHTTRIVNEPAAPAVRTRGSVGLPVGNA